MRFPLCHCEAWQQSIITHTKDSAMESLKNLNIIDCHELHCDSRNDAIANQVIHLLHQRMGENND